MKIPVIQGIIDRRMLINFRIDPKILSNVLPEPFTPKVINGYGIGGVCLIRLKDIRPRFLGNGVGISSENAAHRFAVEWNDEGNIREGVFIPRRDTSSYLNSLVGGRIFPGIHHHANFEVEESNNKYFLEMNAIDDNMHVLVEASISDDIPKTSVFRSLEDSSEFFEKGSLGYSTTKSSQKFDGLELKVKNWKVEPLIVERVESSYFSDESKFPKGSIEFDCGLLMRNIQHEWHGKQDLCCEAI